jgi:hypothetical protein
MDLMVRKPPIMTWRNRSTTMNALDLDGLDDDPVLQELYGGENAGPFNRYVLSANFSCFGHLHLKAFGTDFNTSQPRQS